MEALMIIVSPLSLIAHTSSSSPACNNKLDQCQFYKTHGISFMYHFLQSRILQYRTENITNFSS